MAGKGAVNMEEKRNKGMKKNKILDEIFRCIVKAVATGVGGDIRLYKAENATVTENAVPFVRGDKINTNLRNEFRMSQLVSIKVFHRTAWKGILLIDDTNKMVITICTYGTLNRIIKTKNRRSPHYMQTILNILNAKEKPLFEQMTLDGLGMERSGQFGDDEYEEDFRKLMESDPLLYAGYQYWVIAYRFKNYEVTKIDAILMDKNFALAADKESLMNYLKPDFSELTVELNEEEKNVYRNNKEVSRKDGHLLVSLKAGFEGKQSREPEEKVDMKIRNLEETEGIKK